MSQKTIAFFLLRAAVASVFVYAAIASFITPDNWIGYFPLFLKHLIPQAILLNGFSLYELVLAAWLLLGKFTFFAALLSVVTLCGVIISNSNELDILFRDFAIILSAASLAVFSYKK
ncbi:MAG TPA: DoxX family membrane protein [Candidatus Saccharimonadales bacterium]|nr:DoxX family membrane protein [Candidatus Saccharimonadales bacterium]